MPVQSTKGTPPWHDEIEFPSLLAWGRILNNRAFQAEAFAAGNSCEPG
jgi:hypothetical protein